LWQKIEIDLENDWPGMKSKNQTWANNAGGSVPVLSDYFDFLRGDRGLLCDALPFGNIFFNTNELKRLKSENRKLKQKLLQAQKMEAIGELSSGIAHDFNNILQPIIGSLELLIEDNASDRKLQISLKNILKGANRAGSLVRQILSFSHKSDLEVGPVKIQSIIREVLKLSRATLPSYIKIIQTIDNECGAVNANPTHIYQIAMNLITNAFHAMEHEGGTLDVSLKEIGVTHKMQAHVTLNPGTYVCLGIRDSGSGIDPSIMDKIFDPYFTTKDKESGTGLGLSVIAGIIKNYGGDISFYSEGGKGSLFQVYFPRNQGSFNTNSFKADRQKGLCGGETILFVDDDPFIVEIQQETLKRYGYRVVPFTSSIDALEGFKAQPDRFDMAICDMTMPGMTGLLLAEKIKAIKPGLPIIICTGFSDRINKENFHNMGIDGFLMKPVNKGSSLKLIRQILDQQKNTA